ncbi:methylated-DNA--[protein]-cysteine S-methyltransferase [Halorarum halophilum]|uniref:Methylated-DNA--[protein]-cysteine S-methyltransferase n=1 Tax=Halorarum halophilum TaxID=2743090 RepID=A0A7D5KDK1_9EURY|nr:MGMT family protein [Halobaculum halophilum]QLG26216.1 methylated-DNA--[protein]-cysteine S-methyltransferase [Halobaculum halophilum]
MNDADTGVYARESDRLGRVVELGVAAGRVLSVSFPADLPSDADPDHPILDRLFDYVDGVEDDFADVTLAITVPTAQRNVLDSVRTVPYGDTVTLDLVVRMTSGLDHEDEADLETAREALRANPVPVFVPDHRVTVAEGATPADVAETLRSIES